MTYFYYLVKNAIFNLLIAGWSSLVARRAHNPKVDGSNPSPATNNIKEGLEKILNPLFFAIGINILLSY